MSGGLQGLTEDSVWRFARVNSNLPRTIYFLPCQRKIDLHVRGTLNKGIFPHFLPEGGKNFWHKSASHKHIFIIYWTPLQNVSVPPPQKKGGGHLPRAPTPLVTCQRAIYRLQLYSMRLLKSVLISVSAISWRYEQADHIIHHFVDRCQQFLDEPSFREYIEYSNRMSAFL